MKPQSTLPSRLTRAQWTVIFTLLVVILVSLIGLVSALAADLLYPGGSRAAIGKVFGAGDTEIGTVVYPTVLVTASPFQPLPTNTITTTPTATATATLTATPTATSTATETEIPTPTDTQPPPKPTKTPRPTSPPIPYDSVIIGNIYGQPQSYNLSCESRSAVDWARYFGVTLSETDFVYSLPSSDDPNRGFVGNVNDYGGQIPPNSYGVHAEPVAELLRAYGVPATAVTSMSADAIRREIDYGHPVIAWVIVGTLPGYGEYYTTQDGNTVLVARNEHTVIVIGYDPTGVTILDGGMVYWRSWDVFMASFGALNNMAVVYPS